MNQEEHQIQGAQGGSHREQEISDEWAVESDQFRSLYYQKLLFSSKKSELQLLFKFFPVNVKIFDLKTQDNSLGLLGSVFYFYEAAQVESTSTTCIIDLAPTKQLYSYQSNSQIKNSFNHGCIEKMQLQATAQENLKLDTIGNLMKARNLIFLTKQQSLEIIDHKATRASKSSFIAFVFTGSGDKPTLSSICISNSLLNLLGHSVIETCINTAKYKFVPFEILEEKTFRLFVEKYIEALSKLFESPQKQHEYEISFTDYVKVQKRTKHKMSVVNAEAEITLHLLMPGIAYFQVTLLNGSPKSNSNSSSSDSKEKEEKSRALMKQKVDLEKFYEHEKQEIKALEHIIKINNNIYLKLGGNVCGYRLIEDSLSRNISSDD